MEEGGISCVKTVFPPASCALARIPLPACWSRPTLQAEAPGCLIADSPCSALSHSAPLALFGPRNLIPEFPLPTPAELWTGPASLTSTPWKPAPQGGREKVYKIP